MSFPLFWTRRSGRDRRLADDGQHQELRTGDRRSLESDEYVLIINDRGLDYFTLMVTMPVTALVIIVILGVIPYIVD